MDLDNGVYEAELWNPANGQWRTLAADAGHPPVPLDRDPSARRTGALRRGGLCGGCEAVGYLAQNAEIFTPPYLFKEDGSGQLAPRPSIAPAPAS